MNVAQAQSLFNAIPRGRVTLKGDEELFHGGAPGFHFGDLLLPPLLSGHYATERHRFRFGARSFSLAAVYFTPDRELAERYKEKYPCGGGALYRVRPEGLIKVDPFIQELQRTFPGIVHKPAYCCFTARVDAAWW